MAKSDHDPLDQIADENETLEMQEETVVEAEEVKSAEDSAVNTDNAVAVEASEALEVSEEVAEEVVDVEKKHKSRESTSEKAKKSMAARVEKGLTKEGTPERVLDPLRKRGKKYREVFAKIEKMKLYSIEEAIALVKETSTSKFDSAIEMHIKVKGDGVRGTVVLPNGNGKTKKVAVADDNVIEQISLGNIDFDVLLATPAQMPKLAKFAKVLGPKGLMPSPKAGTVTDDIEKAMQEISGGRIEYRADKNKVVHLSIGKASFSDAQILENYKVIEQVLFAHKIVTISLASTMGPGVKVSLTK